MNPLDDYFVVNEAKMKLVRTNFRKLLDPECPNIIDSLADFLSPREMDELRKRHQNHANQDVMGKLWHYAMKRDYWWIKMEKVLREEGYLKAADILAERTVSTEHQAQLQALPHPAQLNESHVQNAQQNLSAVYQHQYPTDNKPPPYHEAVSQTQPYSLRDQQTSEPNVQGCVNPEVYNMHRQPVIVEQPLQEYLQQQPCPGQTQNSERHFITDQAKQLEKIQRHKSVSSKDSQSQENIFKEKEESVTKNNGKVSNYSVLNERQKNKTVDAESRSSVASKSLSGGGQLSHIVSRQQNVSRSGENGVLSQDITLFNENNTNTSTNGSKGKVSSENSSHVHPNLNLPECSQNKQDNQTAQIKPDSAKSVQVSSPDRKTPMNESGGVVVRPVLQAGNFRNEVPTVPILDYQNMHGHSPVTDTSEICYPPSLPGGNTMDGERISELREYNRNTRSQFTASNTESDENNLTVPVISKDRTLPACEEKKINMSESVNGNSDRSTKIEDNDELQHPNHLPHLSILLSSVTEQDKKCRSSSFESSHGKELSDNILVQSTEESFQIEGISEVNEYLNNSTDNFNKDIMEPYLQITTNSSVADDEKSVPSSSIDFTDPLNIQKPAVERATSKLKVAERLEENKTETQARSSSDEFMTKTSSPLQNKNGEKMTVKTEDTNDFSEFHKKDQQLAINNSAVKINATEITRTHYGITKEAIKQDKLSLQSNSAESLTSEDERKDTVPDAINEGSELIEDEGKDTVPDNISEVSTLIEDERKDTVPDNIHEATGLIEDERKDAVPDNMHEANELIEDERKDTMPDNINEGSELIEDEGKGTVPDNINEATGFSEDERKDTVPDTINEACALIEDERKDAVPDNINEASELIEDGRKDTVPDNINEANTLIEDERKDTVPDNMHEASALIEDEGKDAVPDNINEASALIEDERKDTVPDNISDVSTLIEDEGKDTVPDNINEASALIEDERKDTVPDNINEATGLIEDERKDTVPDIISEVSTLIEDERKDTVHDNVNEANTLIEDKGKDAVPDNMHEASELIEGKGKDAVPDNMHEANALIEDERKDTVPDNMHEASELIEGKGKDAVPDNMHEASELTEDKGKDAVPDNMHEASELIEDERKDTIPDNMHEANALIEDERKDTVPDNMHEASELIEDKGKDIDTLGRSATTVTEQPSRYRSLISSSITKKIVNEIFLSLR